MNPPEEFWKNAVECQRMAAMTRDRTDKATWSQMAERWLSCAKLAQDQISAARFHSGNTRRQRSVSGWAQ